MPHTYTGPSVPAGVARSAAAAAAQGNVELDARPHPAARSLAAGRPACMAARWVWVIPISD